MPDTEPSNAATPRARVAVVAAGVFSPLGRGLAETAASLRTARDCITPVERFSVAQCRSKTAGQVPDEQLKVDHADARRMRRLHRAARMMIVALTEALEQVPGFEPELTVVGT